MTTPKILTNCNQLIPVDRVCWGSWGNVKMDPELCSIYAEKHKSHFLPQKGRVFSLKMPNVFHNGKTRIIVINSLA